LNGLLKQTESSAGLALFHFCGKAEKMKDCMLLGSHSLLYLLIAQFSHHAQLGTPQQMDQQVTSLLTFCPSNHIDSSVHLPAIEPAPPWQFLSPLPSLFC